MKLDFAKRIIYRKKSERIHFWVKIITPFALVMVVYQFRQRTKYNPDEKNPSIGQFSVIEWLMPMFKEVKANLEMMKAIYIDKSTTLEELEEKHEIKVEELREKVYEFPEVLAELKGVKMHTNIDDIKLDDVLSGKFREMSDEEEAAYLRSLSSPPKA